jgi:O-antigen/teichoic acid export membrane protein
MSSASHVPGVRAGGPGGSRIAHNAVLNFLGLAVPLGLAFFVMPIAARYLGAARFGLLGLAWAVTEYLTLFDLGLGRALVKFVADALHHGADELSKIVSLSVIAQVFAGVVGGAVMIAFAPLFVHRVFRISLENASEAVSVFRIVGFSVPVVLLTSAQRAILEGAQRFDLSAMIKMSSSVVSLSIPAIGAVYGASLGAIMLVVLLSRLLICSVYAVAIRRALPTLRWTRSGDKVLARRIFAFGGWVLISNTVSPLLVYFDRFALVALGGLTAAGFYTAPYEGVTRLLIIPVSLIGTMLPALTSLEAKADRARFGSLTASAERTLGVVMAAPLCVVLVFAPELLRLWLGAGYSIQSSTALRILAIGVFANTLAQPLFVALYAKDRPDLPAKFHLIELVIHIPLTVVLIRAFGIAGAAAAWTTRVTIDLALLFWGVSGSIHAKLADIAGGRPAHSFVVLLLLLVGLFGSKLLGAVSPELAAVGAVTTLAGFGVASWMWILRDAERLAITGIARTYLRPLRRIRPA